MRIGILTFHSQLNYGGVLQCWALQTVLGEMGHEVVVIDRRFDDFRSIHKSYFDLPLKAKCKSFFLSLLGANDFATWQRAVRTNRFIKNGLHLTHYHFVEWKNAPSELGIDLIVVGSDQVWHCGNWGDPRPYLLEDGPDIPAIAYAASLGMEKIPNEYEECFVTDLSRFKCISVREISALRLLSPFRQDISVVFDPTLLVAPKEWMRLCDRTKKVRRKLVCYFVNDNEDSFMHHFDRFSADNDYDVEVFMNLQHKSRISLRKPWRLLHVYRNRFRRNVKVRYDAGPEDFVKAFSEADAVIADSFHALMFSTIFRKNVRILRPKADWLVISFSRIQDFVDEFISGPLIQGDIEEALASIERGEKISFNESALNMRIEDSKQWLKNALEKCGIIDNEQCWAAWR